MTESQRKKAFIGVDIGGTNTAYALVDEEGRIIDKGSFATGEPQGYKHFISRLAAELRLLQQSNPGHEALGIGVGAPCGNSLTGMMESPVHLGWGKVCLGTDLQEACSGTRVSVTNDANAAALGEKMYGVARDMDDFIVLTLGTGVGSGIFVGGRLVTGHKGMAGELGHLRYLASQGRQCGCGREGCLDAWCSARGLARTAREMYGTAGELSAYDVYVRAMEGDETAVRTFEKTGEILGSAIADIVTFSEPEAVILFGGLVKAGALLMDPVLRSFQNNVLPMYADIPIMLSAIPEGDAALLGAAALANLDYLDQ